MVSIAYFDMKILFSILADGLKYVICLQREEQI